MDFRGIKKLKNQIATVCWLSFILLSNPVLANPSQYGSIPAERMPTVLDLGATACVPCKMMAPILEKLEVEYRGRAAVIFVDVWKDATEAKRFGIQVIPTQIFFDKQGKEIWRHEGFLDEDTIVKILDSLLKGATHINTEAISPPSAGSLNVQETDSWSDKQIYYTFLVVCGVVIILMAGFGYHTYRKNRRRS